MSPARRLIQEYARREENPLYRQFRKQAEFGRETHFARISCVVFVLACAVVKALTTFSVGSVVVYIVARWILSEFFWLWMGFQRASSFIAGARRSSQWQDLSTTAMRPSEIVSGFLLANCVVLKRYVQISILLEACVPFGIARVSDLGSLLSPEILASQLLFPFAVMLSNLGTVRWAICSASAKLFAGAQAARIRFRDAIDLVMRLIWMGVISLALACFFSCGFGNGGHIGPGPFGGAVTAGVVFIIADQFLKTRALRKAFVEALESADWAEEHPRD